MALEYVFAVIVAVVFIFVSVSISILKPDIIPNTNHVIDVRYACVQYNDTEIDFESFKTLLYGFMTDQCKYFTGKLKQSATIDDLKRAATEIDKKVNVVTLSSCEMPTAAAGNLYLCCSEVLEKDKTFNITRKEITNSDVLICQ